MDCLDDNAINAYVERRMPPDERARVEEHLVACEQCLTIACATAQAPSSIEPLRRIGRYVPIELIGQGGMGSVYVAHDPQLDRSVALKLVRSERSVHPAMQARLEREARAMAKVRHPNVVTIHDVGEHDDAVFLAMELVDGETLRRWLAREPRSWREIVRVFAAAGRGLEAAHGAGIVHRDFKPDNVLVERTGRVAVGDFGVAALAEEAALATIEGGASAALAATQTGAMLGTPRYMAPEQFRGERVDARTDQFGFAVALYEALYGAPPFAGTTTVELARAVTTGRLEPPTRRATVPRRLHRVLVRALSTDREARYASMGDLLEALQTAARPRWRAPAIVAAIAAAAV
ncbi:MAG TPA: protein kinase, partial [Kofleriaceae bacterium]|nr:protein kinase [Kofleriaceae bacterium]